MSNIKIDFSIIGAHRTGTTWLYEKLYNHPEVVLSNNQKELHFFDRNENYKNGLSFYNRHFSEFDKQKLNGDSTPAYLSNRKVPERMAELFPDIKIIAILRNPIDRLFSHYKLNVGNHNVKESFQEYYNRKIKEKAEGRYIYHIKNYLKHFDLEQMHFILYDDLNENPLKVYKECLEFLEVKNTDYVPKKLDQRVNSWGVKKYNSRNKILYKLMLGTKKLKLFNISSSIEKWNMPKNKKETISKKDREVLNYYYNESIVELESFLGRDLHKWKELDA